MRGPPPAPRPAARWPALELPLRPPYALMEAERVREVPEGEGWQYEPKWDGFRCLAFRDGDTVVLQSKSGQPLGRYFPEMEAALAALPARRFVLDGELVIPTAQGLSFDDLLLRIHPAASRVKKLAAESPSALLVFDLLVDEKGTDVSGQPLWERRRHLEAFARRLFPKKGALHLSPATRERALALKWLGSPGMDGVVAKELAAPYRTGERAGMVKVKPLKTADCVVGGFRWASQKSRGVGSLLLGLYNDQGALDHVGFCSSFDAKARKALVDVVTPLMGPPGFTGKHPGGPSRWSQREAEWFPLRPELVVEVSYDYFSQGRFRHGTGFLRWRPDKAPSQCRFDQLRVRQLEPAEVEAHADGGP